MLILVSLLLALIDSLTVIGILKVKFSLFFFGLGVGFQVGILEIPHLWIISYMEYQRTLDAQFTDRARLINYDIRLKLGQILL
jgi:hypothetical protein